MINTEILHKELDLIQGCINRMAHNSFMLKGWMLTVLAAIWAFTISSNATLLLCSISLVIIWAFWYLDAFFLRTEKMYRKMYEWVIIERKNNNEEYLYDLNPHRFKDAIESHFKIMRSITLRYFYGIPFLLFSIIIFGQIVMMILNSYICDLGGCHVVWMHSK